MEAFLWEGRGVGGTMVVMFGGARVMVLFGGHGVLGCVYVCVYIYIWGAITSISGPKKGQHFKFYPVSKEKNKHPHLVWGFFTFQCFVFFLIFAFYCISFSSFPLLLDFLKPKSGPSNEVIGYGAILYIYIYSLCVVQGVWFGVLVGLGL